MAVKLGQSLRQTQNLVMTPQLQQAIKLLTLTHLEMTTVISQEMVENPLLEELGAELEDVEKKSDLDYEIEKLESENKEAAAENFSEETVVPGNDFDWNNYLESVGGQSQAPTSAGSKNQNDSEESPNYENIVSKGVTLADHLDWQLRMENLSEIEYRVALEIIHNINDDGYLDIDVQELAQKSKFSVEQVTDLIRIIQTLDPVGCGSRTLSECLLAQAKLLNPRTPLVELIIREHMDDLQKRDYPKIVASTGVSKDRIKSAEVIIHSLNPKPGRLISPEDTEYIVPDIYVRNIAGEWVVQLNEEGVPRLRVSNLYKSMMKATNDSKAQEYVEDKLRAAMWLIKSIQNRQKTIVKVAEAIVKYQPEFFRKGAEFLRPMVLRDIANEIGMHESTVSRVTTNKYMHTPLGLFELKFFFNTGVGGKSGGIDVASESLRMKIKTLIQNESPKRPLSDQKIVELLAREEIVVARRTVAKYREMLNILPSAKRKKID